MGGRKEGGREIGREEGREGVGECEGDDVMCHAVLDMTT